jgi:site-specific recombinase XerC
MLLDWLPSGGILPFNPAASVRGPKHINKRGKTPVLTAAEARQLLDSIDTGSLIGSRDRAWIGAMVYSFAHATVVGRNGVNFVMEGHSLDRSEVTRRVPMMNSRARLSIGPSSLACWRSSFLGSHSCSIGGQLQPSPRC